MTKIGAIIQSGESLPPDVIQVLDKSGDPWALRESRGWYCLRFRDEPPPDAAGYLHDPNRLADLWGPLTVTAVREPEPQRLVICQYGSTPHPIDDECSRVRDAEPTDWASSKACAHAAIHVHGADGSCPYEPEPLVEPQQVDTSTLLDLVRQYGNAFAQLARTLGDLFPIVQARDFVNYEEEAREAQALFARIAALLPQQPVQAHGDEGDLPLWIHICGHVAEASEAPTVSGCCDDGLEGVGPWRPLLVGGDPAPEAGHTPAGRPDNFLDKLAATVVRREQPSAPDFLASINTLTIQREEARAEVERLKGVVRTEIEQADDHAAWADRLAWAALRRTGVRETEEASGNEELWQLALDALTAQSDPLVLSLPEVDPQATLIGGARWVPHSMPGWWVMEGGSLPHELGTVLDYEEGTVRVELAPPREPRTWPKLDSAAGLLDDLPARVIVDRHGIWERVIGSALFAQADAFGAIRVEDRLRLDDLRRLGEVFEVFDDEPGGTA